METYIIIIISVLGLIVVFMGWGIFNLLKKIETAEDLIIEYSNYLNKLSQIIEISDKKLNDLDYKGTFKSDDEVGFFFNSVKDIQSILNDFVIKEVK